MNKLNQSCFDGLNRAATEYKDEITKAMQRYRAAEVEARKESAQFKDEDGAYKARMVAAKANARNAITAAETAFSSRIQTEIKLLKKELDEHLLNRPSQALVEAVRLFRDFNLPPSKGDINALLNLAGGNTLGLRCINSMLEGMNSPYKVDFPETSDFEADVEALEKLARGHFDFTPADFHHEAVEIYSGQQITYFNRGGVPYTTGQTYDSLSLLMRRAEFEKSINALDEMAERWTNSVIPSVVQAKDYTDTKDEKTGEITTAAEQYMADRDSTKDAAQIVDGEPVGVKLARDSGKKRAEGYAKAKEGVERFKV